MLVSVAVTPAEELPTITGPNATDAGATTAPGTAAMPVPPTLAVRGESAAVEFTFSVALRGPTPCGVKITPAVQDAWAARTLPVHESEDVVKSAGWAPVNVRERMVTDPAVVLVTVTGDGAVATPCVWAPKSIDAGLTARLAPVPLRPTV